MLCCNSRSRSTASNPRVSSFTPPLRLDARCKRLPRHLRLDRALRSQRDRQADRKIHHRQRRYQRVALFSVPARRRSRFGPTSQRQRTTPLRKVRLLQLRSDRTHQTHLAARAVDFSLSRSDRNDRLQSRRRAAVANGQRSSRAGFDHGASPNAVAEMSLEELCAQNYRKPLLESAQSC